MEKKLEYSGRKLCNPLIQKWIKLAEEEEKNMLSIIRRIFEKYKRCMRTLKKPPKWDRDRVVDSLTDEEQEQKNLFKSWFVIGTNKVLRSLEKDELCLVLGEVGQRNVVINMVLSLAGSCQCPAVCVSELLSTVQTGWPNLTSVSVLAVKKMTESNDFLELVDFVNRVVPVPDGKDNQSQEQDKSVIKEKETPPPTNKGDKSVTTANSSKEQNKIEENKHSDTSSNQLHKQSKISLKPSSSVLTPCEIVKTVTVDPTKYHVLKTDNNSVKTFDSQDFISFGEEQAEDKHVYIVDGRICSSEVDRHDLELYGIAPAFSLIDDGQATAPFQGRKRALRSSSSYKGINIKQAKRDMDSARQKKKQQKRLKQKKFRGKNAK